MSRATTSRELGAWNPGVASQIPAALLPLSTLFRPENVSTSVAEARALRDFSGLELEEVVAFRPERLVLHELLIRVTADYTVPDGPRQEDLGIHFRHMVASVLAGWIAPRMGEVRTVFEELRRRLRETIDRELATGPGIASTAAATRLPERGLRAWWYGLARSAVTAQEEAGAARGDERELWRYWEAKAGAGDGDELQRAACRALARVVGALFNRHGRLWGESSMIAALATDLACNDCGSEAIGRLIEPWLAEAARALGYRPLPLQRDPIVLNTKGASASGKSTLRPEQKRLAERIGASWDDFAVISPDIWRKQLLDYASLGPAFRYAGSFTGHELQIVDHKLDRYIARKSESQGISHLLIDRFRFDSFSPADDKPGKRLLTRFGHTVYLFFMITPPQDTVERAWKRGLEVGRYKALDDLLAHNVEAYSGMPRLFFTWAQRADKRVHYEFLDNSVALGERPRTVAFGWNGEMNVLDVKCLLDVDRYAKIEVGATAPEGLYADAGVLAGERNTRFLVQCARRLAHLNFAEQESGLVYLRLAAGCVEWIDPPALARALADPDTRAGILAVVPNLAEREFPCVTRPTLLGEMLGAERIHTLGNWGAGCFQPRPGFGEVPKAPSAAVPSADIFPGRTC